MRELAVFSRQFATLVASGMPMLRTLHSLEEQTQDDEIREATAGIRADVEAGSTLEQAMGRHPKVFDRLFRAMVRSGEQSGRLEDALDRIAFQVEKTDALRRQVKSALMYPALVFGFAVVVLVAIVVFVIPVFVNVFKEIAEEHPGESTSLPRADAALRRRLQSADRLLVRDHSRPGSSWPRSSSAGSAPNAAKKPGIASPCGSPSRSAT